MTALSAPSDFFLACIHFSKSPSLLSDCHFLKFAPKMRAPHSSKRKERTMSNSVIAMNGLLDAEYFDFESAHVSDTFRIFVAKPPFADKDKRYPAIYAADGNGAFSMVTSIQRTLSWGGEAPAAHVIGIGYPTEGGYLQAISKRNRDYPPTDGGDYARAMLGPTFAAGGKAFLRFLTLELKPELESRYAIDASDSTFFGSSLGGLFGAWVLLTLPATFQRYILASPAITWNDEEVWHWERTYAAAHDNLSATVFLSAGELEAADVARRYALETAENNPMLRPRIEVMIAWFEEHGWPRTAEIGPELAAKMNSRNYSSLKIHCHNMPDETHMSVSPAVISRGLRYVFGHWKP
jgi:predicted alpha/beta superfamily hydrolase